MNYLNNLPKLETLSVFANKVTSIPSSDNFSALQTLDLGRNSISSISGINTFLNLSKLDLYGNQISNISQFSTLTDLKWLRLDLNYFSSISALNSLVNTTIELNGTSQLSCDAIDSLRDLMVNGSIINRDCAADENVWTYQYYSAGETGETVPTAVIDSNGTAYLSIQGEGLYAINADGSLAWQHMEDSGRTVLHNAGDYISSEIDWRGIIWPCWPIQASNSARQATWRANYFI